MEHGGQAKEKRHHILWGPVAAVVGTIAIYFGAQFIAVVLFGIYSGLSGLSVNEAEGLLNNSVVTQFFWILLVEAATLGLLYWVLKGSKANFRTLGLRRPKLKDLGYALIGLGLYIPSLILVSRLTEVLLPQIDQEQSQQLGFDAAVGGWQLILVFISLVVLPPLVEEILVRGYLYLGLKKSLPKVWAVILTSFVFAVAHLQLGAGAPPLWAAAIDTFVLSVILIYVRDVTNGLWAPIGLHAMKNGLAFLVLFIFPIN